MTPDPRAVLDEAAQRRAPCQARLSGEVWRDAEIVRVERGGVVVLIPGLRLIGGEELRIWLRHEGRSYSFDATVLRAGVPVSDRTPFGALVGFIGGWQSDDGGATDGLALSVLTPNGRGVSVLSDGGHLIDLRVEALSFTVPRDTTLKFIEGARLVLSFEIAGQQPHVVAARVSRAVPGEDHLLYALSFDHVVDEQRHLGVIEAFRVAVER